MAVRPIGAGKRVIAVILAVCMSFASVVTFMTATGALAHEIDITNMPPPWISAVPDDGIDDTMVIWSALDTQEHIYAPWGGYDLNNPDFLPLKVWPGQVFRGDGPTRTILRSNVSGPSAALTDLIPIIANCDESGDSGFRDKGYTFDSGLKDIGIRINGANALGVKWTGARHGEVARMEVTKDEAYRIGHADPTPRTGYGYLFSGLDNTRGEGLHNVDFHQIRASYLNTACIVGPGCNINTVYNPSFMYCDKGFTFTDGSDLGFIFSVAKKDPVSLYVINPDIEAIKGNAFDNITVRKLTVGGGYFDNVVGNVFYLQGGVLSVDNPHFTAITGQNYEYGPLRGQVYGAGLAAVDADPMGRWISDQQSLKLGPLEDANGTLVTPTFCTLVPLVVTATSDGTSPTISTTLRFADHGLSQYVYCVFAMPQMFYSTSGGASNSKYTVGTSGLSNNADDECTVWLRDTSPANIPAGTYKIRVLCLINIP